jgi:hypothetical protein
MATDIDPKVDYVFKRLCGDEDNALVLVDVLNAVLATTPSPLCTSPRHPRRPPLITPVRGYSTLNSRFVQLCCNRNVK